MIKEHFTPKTRARAFWIFTTLLHMARRSKKRYNHLYRVVEELGQVATTATKLAAETIGNRDKVPHILNVLKLKGEITCDTTDEYTLITINNIWKYVEKAKPKEGGNSTPHTTPEPNDDKGSRGAEK